MVNRLVYQWLLMVKIRWFRLTKPLLPYAQVIDSDSDFELHPKHVTVHESDSDSSFHRSSFSIPPPVNTAIVTSSATFTMPSSSRSMSYSCI